MAAQGLGAPGLKQEPGGGEPQDATGAQLGASGAGSGADPGDAVGSAPNVKLPPDPNDPEVVAAALTARITAAGASIIFEKSLTASDVSGGGRVVVPKSVAEQYFPKLEQPSGVSISASDLDGRSYTFKWRFWVNNSSRMYLLEGAGELHRNYGLEVGDVMVFAQKPDGSLVVAGRAANKSDLVKKPPIKRPAAATGGGGAVGGGHAFRAKEARTARAAPRAPSTAAASDAAAAPAAGGLTAARPGNAAASGGAAAAAAAGAAAAAVGAGVADGGLRARGRKRKASAPPPGWTESRFRPRSEEGASLAVLEMEAPSDGIFRALVTQYMPPVPLGVALARNNRWTATLDVAGEIYQAFFDTREDAVEAVTAAGASP